MLGSSSHGKLIVENLAVLASLTKGKRQLTIPYYLVLPSKILGKNE